MGEVRATNEPFYLVDAGGRLLDTSELACERLQYRRDDLLSVSVPVRGSGVNLVHGLSLERFQQFFAEIFSSGPQLVQAFHRRSDGSIYLVEGLLRGLSTPLGRYMFVTEREAATAVAPQIETADLVGGSAPSSRALLALAEVVAPADATVLLQGETGTGKSRLAEWIHKASRRSQQPFVEVNCAALAPSLLESELFGHEKGAFTGATERRRGRFELAAGGTLFLDEIGELPRELQAKLLRVLQSGQFERVGGTQTLISRARLIAATNKDLAGEVVEGRFRSDLFFRLNVLPLTLPPLRERRADIPDLVAYFVRRIAQRIGRPVPRIPAEVQRRCQDYGWPGNIRELENAVERALILERGPELQLEGLGGVWGMADDAPFVPLLELQRRHIERALNLTSWRVSGARGAAKLLGLKATTLEARMKKLGLRRPPPASLRGRAGG